MTYPGDRVGDNLPTCDTNDPASLEAFYGNFGFCEAYRKVVLSNCAEIVRATFAMTGDKVSETRMLDLARTHPLYLDFLGVHLQGRRLREQNVLSQVGA